MKYLGYGFTEDFSVKGSIERIFCPHQDPEFAYYLVVQFLDDNGAYGKIARIADDDASAMFVNALLTKQAQQELEDRCPDSDNEYSCV